MAKVKLVEFLRKGSTDPAVLMAGTKYKCLPDWLEITYPDGGHDHIPTHMVGFIRTRWVESPDEDKSVQDS